MDRNSWETAIRCLEVALHPNTGDAEVLAAVNGFRRTADGASLVELCGEFAGRDGAIVRPAAWSAVLARLGRENFDLRLQLELARTGQDAADRRLRDLGDELRDVRRRAALAEQRVGELNSAHAEITDGLKRQIADMRGTLDRARRPAPSARPAPLAASFADVFAAARRGAGQPSVPDYQADGAGWPGPAPASRSPWTA